MLHLRLVSAAILIASMALLIYMDSQSSKELHGLWLIPAGLFFVAGTSLEFGRLAHSKWGLRYTDSLLGAMAVFLATSTPILYPLFMQKAYPADCPIGKLGLPLVAFLLCMSLFAVRMLRDFDHHRELSLLRWGLATLITAYVGFGASFWILIRTYQPNTWSLWALVGILATTKISDAGAYFVGKSIGSRKLCPTISPGKTVEGALGGLASGVFFAWFWFSFLLPSLFQAEAYPSHTLTTIFFGFLLTIVGMLGDLVESVAKRSVGSKDSGSTLPGLGGIWDVTDSILPTAVAGYLGIVADLIWMPA
ncbi:MAG: phosphatidate cytidylyltransferase [Pirellulales bacterium]